MALTDHMDWTGILLVNKPVQATSFSMIKFVRKLTGIRRVGHIGTLDPFAEGLLPVCIGRATAAVQFMESYDKIYQVHVRFGQATDTQDLTGQTTDAYQLTATEREQLLESDFLKVRQAVSQLTGIQEQLPPMYSAVKKDGRPLYAYAREGKTIERQTKTIEVKSVRILKISLTYYLDVWLEIDCSKGTYIRTLADTLGRRLGYFAHAAALTRVRCGPFSLEQACDPDQLSAWRDETEDILDFQDILRQKGCFTSLSEAFKQWPRLNLNPDQTDKLVCGQPVLFAAESSGEPFDVNQRYGVFCGPLLIAAARLQWREEGFYRIKTERVFVDRADISRQS